MLFRSIAPCDTKIAAFSIAGALNWICMWYEPDGALSAEEIAAQFARTLTQGLVAGNRSHRRKGVVSGKGATSGGRRSTRLRVVFKEE